MQVNYKTGDRALTVPACMVTNMHVSSYNLQLQRHASPSCLSIQTDPETPPHCHISPASNCFILEMYREKDEHNVNKGNKRNQPFDTVELQRAEY